MAKNETISDIIYDSWFDVATQKHGYVTAIESIIANNPAIWLPITAFSGSYTAQIEQGLTIKKPILQ
jgi:hypothetical protein